MSRLAPAVAVLPAPRTKSGTVHVALEDVQAVPGDRRLAVAPGVSVQPTAADFFAGRDPVFATALR